MIPMKSQPPRPKTRFNCKYCRFGSRSPKSLFKHVLTNHQCTVCGNFFPNPKTPHDCTPYESRVNVSENQSPWNLLSSAHIGVLQSYYLVPNSTISTIEEIFNLNYDSIASLINRVLQTHESIRFQFQLEVSLSKPGWQNTTQVYLNSEFFILFNIRMLDEILLLK